MILIFPLFPRLISLFETELDPACYHQPGSHSLFYPNETCILYREKNGWITGSRIISRQVTHNTIKESIVINERKSFDKGEKDFRDSFEYVFIL